MISLFLIWADAYGYRIWRAWYNGSYTMMAKPVRALELHYPMVQFLINAKLKYTLSFDRDCKLRITLWMIFQYHRRVFSSALNDLSTYNS